MRFSLLGKMVLMGLVSLIVSAMLAAIVFKFWFSTAPWFALLLAVLVACIAWLFFSSRVIAPVVNQINALTDNIASMKDNDFSVSVANTRSDELGQLVDAHNELSGALREERQSLYQRELLLDTVIQSTSIALILVDAHDTIVYSNASARHLLWKGRPLNGETFAKVLEKNDVAFAHAIAREADGLFTIEGDSEPQTYHLSHNDFTLNVRSHRLYLIKHLTQELNRQEVATWKKVIRVISHELNNSLAPISSLAHSGATLQAKSRAKSQVKFQVKSHVESQASLKSEQADKTDTSQQLATIFNTIEERASHLKQFIEGYARFARLPAPHLEDVLWTDFVEGLRRTLTFNVVGEVPAATARIDAAQLEQVLINLIKNAHESGSGIDDVTLSIRAQSNYWQLEIADRGKGMSEKVFASALLPFYSTKKTGTGLGLPLCREIVEAHGGRMSLSNRQSLGHSSHQSSGQTSGGLTVTLLLPR